MNDEITDISNIKEEAPSMNVFDKDNNLDFWWYDAFEHRDRGYVYLFGKVLDKDTKKYNSCCVIIQNIERNLFILPRTHKIDGKGNVTDEKVELEDVYNEFSEICTKNQIKKWASKVTTRKYAFEVPGVPQEAEYLKVVYNYNEPSLSNDLTGKTFSHTFGAQTGPLEHFLIKRDIMGPCWLRVKNAKINNNKESWCKVECIVSDPKSCNPMPDSPTHGPPLVIMSLNLRTILNRQKNSNEIVAISALVCNQVKIDEPTPIEDQPKQRFTAIRQLANTPYPPGFQDIVNKERQQNKSVIQLERTEASLLNYLLARIHMCDPDVIVGHNFTGFDLDVLLHRMKALGTQHWHKLGRLKRKNWPKLQAGAGGARESTYQERMIMCGRLICDTYLASKDLIRSKSYRMTDLAKSQLKIEREDIEFDKISNYYHDAHSLLHMVKHNSFDTYLSMALMFKLQILPLTKQLTNLAGNLWARTITGARAERNEFLLLHEFHRQKYICPDKSFNFKSQEALDAIEQDGDNGNKNNNTYAEKTKTKSKGRRKPAYSGGLVLEPKSGYYDKYVLLLDFNSLYPSIIQEYNICFTTVQRDLNVEKSDDNDITTEAVPNIPEQNLPQGILPRLLKTLVERRRQVKNMMKDTKISKAEMMQLDIRQKGLKLTANSMYGCLGFSHSRFYAKPLAMLITHKGREILQNTVDLAGKLNLNVIYGDTDSIMVYTNENELDKVKEMGNLLKQKVNEHYKLLEIDIDGFFKHMLLLRKKKYAALLVEEKPNGELVETVETKGLDLVRRDWCDLSHDVSSHVLELILSNLDREEVVEKIHAYLREVGDQIRNNEVPLEKFVINKQLTKSPEEYSDAKSQPHVQVALRMRQAGLPVNAGDTVPFVICNVEGMAGGSKGFAERAYHFNDVKNGDKKLDLEWYLSQQVHPPVGRLCSPIEDTSLGMLAECLGLDGSKYVHVTNSENDDYVTLESQISDEIRFKNCERLSIRCQSCKSNTIYNGVVRIIDEKTMEYGLSCSTCQKIFPMKSVYVQVTVAIRNYIRKYYEGWLVCDDGTCANRTRMMSVFGRRCLVDGCQGAVVREVKV
ncbi:DNA polymerase family B-domain-containing protein [Cunninghamella echinulata]|nr:DNA polymerase family B-domain-containing protein [Cunninghamella echinulata]